MKLKHLFLFLLTLCSSFAGEKISSLRLDDQFGNSHKISFPLDRPLLVTAADLKGSDSMNPWVSALTNRFASNVVYVGIADVRAVPRPMRPFVRSKFRKKYSYPVLLDWNGTLLEQISPKEGVPNVYLFNQSGDLLHHLHGPVTKEGLSKLQRLLAPPKQRAPE